MQAPTDWWSKKQTDTNKKTRIAERQLPKEDAEEIFHTQLQLYIKYLFNMCQFSFLFTLFSQLL